MTFSYNDASTLQKQLEQLENCLDAIIEVKKDDRSVIEKKTTSSKTIKKSSKPYKIPKLSSNQGSKKEKTKISSRKHGEKSKPSKSKSSSSSHTSSERQRTKNSTKASEKKHTDKNFKVPKIDLTFKSDEYIVIEGIAPIHKSAYRRFTSRLYEDDFDLIKTAESLIFDTIIKFSFNSLKSLSRECGYSKYSFEKYLAEVFKIDVSENPENFYQCIERSLVSKYKETHNSPQI